MQGFPFGGAVERSETERVRPCKKTLSVTAFGRATSPERERLWQGRKVYSLMAGFFLPLTGEDETHPLCQGLHLSGKTSPGRGKMSPPGDKKGSELAPQATERVRPCKKPQGLPKGPGVSRFISLGVCALIPLRPGRRVLQRRLRPQPPSQPAPPQSALRRLHPAPPSRPVLRRRARCGPAPSPYRPRPGA